MGLYYTIALIFLTTVTKYPTVVASDSKADVSRVVGQQTQLSGAQDCCVIQQRTGASVNGIYDIYPYDDEPNSAVQVYCDFKSDGGGWTVFQRRNEVDGPTQKFFRNWKNYEIGFGSLQNSHWLGLSNIAALTAGYNQALRVDLLDWEGESRFANYGLFYVGGKSTTYKLTSANYSGSAGDSLGGNGLKFSTYDMDHDTHSTSCAEDYKGAWWYGACHSANLNGIYVVNGSYATFATGVVWHAFHGHHYGMKTAEMKIRNNNFPSGCGPAIAFVPSIHAA